LFGGVADLKGEIGAPDFIADESEVLLNGASEALFGDMATYGELWMARPSLTFAIPKEK
jgi:hypothetical protein